MPEITKEDEKMNKTTKDNLCQVDFNGVYFSYASEDDEEEEKEAKKKETKGSESAEGAAEEKEKKFAVKNVSLRIQKGEFVAIVGRNGSGKSTMAKLMNSLIVPTEGTIFVDGIDTADDDYLWEIRSRVGMVFQNPDNQIIGASVEEDVAFGLENLGVPRPEMLERIDWATEKVGIAGFRKSDPQTMSGGQKQRVAIAGILAMKPDCIVLDEATAMLDPVGRAEVMEIIRKLNRENGITIIHITHHMDEVAVFNRAVLVDNGEVKFDGTPEEMFADRGAVEAAGLEVPGVTALFDEMRDKYPEANGYFTRTVLTVDDALEELEKAFRKKFYRDGKPGEEVKYFTAGAKEERRSRNAGRKAHYLYREGSGSMRVENLSYIYGEGTPFQKKAISGISFRVGDGEIFGIIGHTGCGKSTLVQHLNGLLRASEGTVSIDGKKLDDRNVREMRRKVGLVFQYPEYQLFEPTVGKDIAFGISKWGLSGEEIDKRVKSAAQKVGLDEEVLERSIYDLSGGQKRRVAIAGILVMEPEVLVLDEPAAGLDPEGRNSILALIRSLRENAGTTVIIVSHSMEIVAENCDRILVMNSGGAEMCGTPGEVFCHEERLKEIGLSVPQMSVLFRRLSERLPEMNILPDIYTIDDAVNELGAFFGRGQVS